MATKISIAGDLGSGKTTVGRELARRLGYRYLATGQIHRSIADEMGMDALQLSVYAETHPEIDKRIDMSLFALNDTPDDFVIDSRMAWHFVRNSLKVYLKVDEQVASERIVADRERRNEPEYTGREHARQELMARRESETRRYFASYGVNCADLTNYDVVVDTTAVASEDVVECLIALLARWKVGARINNWWVSPKLLLPTENIRVLARDDAAQIENSVRTHGFDENQPISVVSDSGLYFIWDGHKRVSAALHNNVRLVPVLMLASNGEEIHAGHSADAFAKASADLSLYYDWEDAHGFTFGRYPNVASAR